MKDESTNMRRYEAAEVMGIGLTAKRTSCACAECTTPCRIKPGYLLPRDLRPLAIANRFMDDDAGCTEFAMNYLNASPGAKVMKERTVFHIPTLVPRMINPGTVEAACTFLTIEGKCAVHDVSPFGCGYFDYHQTDARYVNALASWGLQQIWDDMKQNGLYTRIWKTLKEAGYVGEDLEALNYRLRKAEKKLR